LVPPRHERSEPRFQRETAPPLVPPVLKDGAQLSVTAPSTLEHTVFASAPSIASASSPSVDGAPLPQTSLPGVAARARPIGVSEITSEILGEHPHPDDPPRTGEGDFRPGPAPAAARRLEPDVPTPAIQPDTPMTPVSATGRVRSRSRDTFAEPVGNEPVRVTIGRIEVRAPAPATAPPPSAEPPMVPRLSLAEYLQQRDREDGR
jgi:hypothetical protein